MMSLHQQRQGIVQKALPVNPTPKKVTVHDMSSLMPVFASSQPEVSSQIAIHMQGEELAPLHGKFASSVTPQ